MLDDIGNPLKYFFTTLIKSSTSSGWSLAGFVTGNSHLTLILGQVVKFLNELENGILALLIGL